MLNPSRTPWGHRLKMARRLTVCPECRGAVPSESNYCRERGFALTEVRPMRRRRLRESLMVAGLIMALAGPCFWQSTSAGTWTILLGLVLMIVGEFTQE